MLVIIFHFSPEEHILHSLPVTLFQNLCDKYFKYNDLFKIYTLL
jgi:hypothetical protein